MLPQVRSCSSRRRRSRRNCAIVKAGIFTAHQRECQWRGKMGSFDILMILPGNVVKNRRECPQIIKDMAGVQALFDFVQVLAILSGARHRLVETHPGVVTRRPFSRCRAIPKLSCRICTVNSRPRASGSLLSSQGLTRPFRLLCTLENNSRSGEIDCCGHRRVLLRLRGGCVRQPPVRWGRR